MIKNTLLISLLLLSQNSFAQCTEQKNFNVNWKFNENNVLYEIKRKDGADFSYYKYDKNFNQIYNGIKLDKSINLTRGSYAIFRAYPSADFDRVSKLLRGNNNHLSLYINSKGSSETYKFPFEKNHFIMTERIIDNLNIEKNIFIYQDIVVNNDIYGKHKLKYYIILFHDEYGRKCSYFESPEIEYDFGRKPLSLIWKDFWN